MDAAPPLHPCRIIGVLDDGPAGLTAAALAELRAADLVIAGRRLLGLCADQIASTAERRDLTGRLAQVPDWIDAALAQGRRVVVLATGDPLFHGIGGYLNARLPAERLEILPNVSTVQLACARLGLAWQDLRVVSVHGRDSGEWWEGAGPEHGLYPIAQALRDSAAEIGQAVPDLVPPIRRPDGVMDRVGEVAHTPPLPNPPPPGGRESDKATPVTGRNPDDWQSHPAGRERALGREQNRELNRDVRMAHLAILTSPANGPDRIARLLLQEGLGDVCRLAVVSRLRRPDERVTTDLTPAAAADMGFPDPNVVVLSLKCPRRPPVRFGLADDGFLQRQPDKRLITKREVRALSLARLQLRGDSIVWDIGAGSGALGLEAALLCPHGFVHAVEKNAADAEIARENRRRLGVTNYRLTQARAPEGLTDWPDPDAVFIGGSGGELPALIRLALTRLRDQGWLVMNFVTLENLHLAMTLLKELHVRWDLTQLQAARSQPLLDMHRLVPENPVWILAATGRAKEMDSAADADAAADSVGQRSGWPARSPLDRR